jgi:uncharacterized protein (TIGR02594 family)
MLDRQQEQSTMTSPSNTPIPLVYRVAVGELDEKEIFGVQHNPRILEYHKVTDLSATDDETPWCASFVSWCIEMAGGKSTRSASARSYLGWGVPVDVPQVGDVVVLRRGTKPWQGHVGLFSGREGGRVWILGGNQKDQVCVQDFPENQVLGYRRAPRNQEHIYDVE